MPSAIRKRVLGFIQSVRPADPAHALLLLGATFLFIAGELRWWPAAASVLVYFHSEPRPDLTWISCVRAMTLPMLVAGAVAGYLCLVAVLRPLRVFVLGVLLPALVTLVTIPIVGLHWFPQMLAPDSAAIGSILEASRPPHVSIPQSLSSLGPGLQTGVAGFVLVAIFAVLLWKGHSTLPVRLRFSSAGSIGEISAEDDRRTVLFVWMMICLMPLVSLAHNRLLGPVYFLFHGSQTSPGVFSAADKLCLALALFALVFVAAGRDRWTAVRESLRLPPLRYVGIAALIPMGLASVPSFIRYFLAVQHWAESGIGRYMRPSLGDYFAVPHGYLYWYFAPAVVEEIAWRGYLQPRFVRRYGLVRGIFFVGIVWGAFHFASDFDWRMTAAGVAFQIARRLAETIAQAYVLGWLTIRSRSILPAAIAHALFNMSLSANGFLKDPVYIPVWVIALAWAVVGYLLFHHFPLGAANDEAIAGPAANLEAAT
jgi:membrane protease YdiL (CAAX protease family)